MKLLAGAAAVTLAGTLALVIAASASPFSRSVRMAPAVAGGPARPTPTGAQLQGQVSESDSLSAAAAAGASSAAMSASSGIISTVTNGLKNLAGSVGSPRLEATTTTSSTAAGATTSTTTDDNDNDNDEGGEHGFVAGTVASVTGTGFSVTVSGSATPKSVATSASTMFVQTMAGTVADATVGTEVLAIGTRDAAGALAATKLAVLPAVQTGSAAKPAPKSETEGGKEGRFVFGKVTANTGGTLTVDTPSGPQTVATTAATTVTTTKTASLSAVTVGATVQVKGTVAADGQITAQLVHIGTAPLGLGGDDRDGLGAGLDREVGSTPDAPSTSTKGGGGHD